MYHGLHHTIDVLDQAERIAIEEGVIDADDILILKVACLYHDIGFLVAYNGHEEEGCVMAKEELPGFDFSDQQIETICRIIMATKIPQTPLSHMEKIICDADLDYLGRPDFFLISRSLFWEMKARDYIKDEKEWDLLQTRFIASHSYFTLANQNLREKQKQEHLKMLEAKVEARA
ncbi:MAG: HD domain-containing protein [Bacteroidota bacterium]